MEQCDVLIVGGGPAGSTLAWKLRGSGLNIHLIDKAYFPRDKTCAGWITPQIVDELALDLNDYAQERVLQPIQAFRTGIIGQRSIHHVYDAPISYGILRRQFDHYLLQRCGATLHLGEPVHSISREADGWLVNERLQARLLVGAGGHFCPVAQYLGARLGHDERIVAAKEVEFALNETQRHDCPVSATTPELYFCPDLQGYGWIFRKGDYLNIGLGREDNHQLTRHLDAFVHWLSLQGRIPSELPARYKGHAYLLYSHARRTLIDDGVLLIGDAVGLAYAQSGEGIRPAVESALLAAGVIGQTDQFSRMHLAAYEQRLLERFGSNRGKGNPTEWLPETLRQTLGRRLLSNPYFARRVLLDQWFLHRNLPALVA